MKVAAYIRVSTIMQVEEGYSLSAQKERLKAFAFSQNWEIVQFYVDEGLSAKDMDRPELQRMLKGVRKGVFDIVLVYKLDRLTRSVIDLDKLLTEFSEHDVMFKSATEVYDTTTATGRLFIRLVASMAQWERENLGERVRFGMQEKAREGKWTVSTPPLGYNSEESVLKINPTEALIVKEVYSLYLQGMGMHKIARNLNERGLYTKKDKPWAQSTIQYILTNPIYHGTTRYNYRVNADQYFEVEGAVPAIITEEEFKLTQQMIEKRKHTHPRQATSKFIFSKVLKCGRCGKTLIGKTSQSRRGEKVYYSYGYYCPNRQRSLCDLPLISQTLFEQKFIQMIELWDLHQEANEILNNEVASSVEDYAETIQKLENELKEIENRRSRWQYAWVKGMFSKIDSKNDEEFQKRMKEEDEKEKIISKEIYELKSNDITQEDSNIKIWTDIKLNWNHMSDEIKKQFILIAVNFMKVDKINKDKTPDSIEIKEVRLN
ncbi:recombinase family protein [Neobacillus sp. WH10]|uniref:recombinase family protein n=1 Tax=Neobacillus sp. WH10 TaxID=3047873 RepID=UPI0024C1A1DA|nr:recombinase family protein [Neobacillus sp. WH10]WHY76108.1 recombinase family protein [Neobacillus sp. WH10]